MRVFALLLFLLLCMSLVAQKLDSVSLFTADGKTVIIQSNTDTCFQFIVYQPPVCSGCLKDTISNFRVNFPNGKSILIVNRNQSVLNNRISEKSLMKQFPVDKVLFSNEYFRESSIIRSIETFYFCVEE